MSAMKTEEDANGTSTANGGGRGGVCEEGSVTVLSPTDLSEMLAAGTKEVHEKAENTEFVKDFLKGRIRKELFKLGHVALFFTYSAMEEEIERNKEHPHFAPLYFPHELHRRDALARDLEFFYGEDWQSRIRISPATQRYVDRIRQVGRDQPALLVAHAYTRYMGDLSGGQVLRKVAQRALKLPPTGEGLSFYEFDGIHSAKAFKQLYRSRMNELELDTHTKSRVVEEANLAFQFNMEIFGELEEVGKTLQDDVLDAAPAHGEIQGDVSQCPYHAAKTAASNGSSYVCQVAMTVLKNPSGQVLLAAWIAALAGLAAWYLMSGGSRSEETSRGGMSEDTQIWQTGAVCPSAIIPHVDQIINPVCAKSARFEGSVSEMLICLTLLLVSGITDSRSEQFVVVGPADPVLAVAGEDVILPCSVNPSISVVDMRVEWFRPDLKDSVHLYDEHEDRNADQIQSYRGRTKLIHQELQRGDASLKLSTVRVSDEGRYKCFIQSKSRYDDVTVDVRVEAVGRPPVITVVGFDGSGGFHLQCESEGWYPEPDLEWLDSEGVSLSSETTETHRNTDRFNVKHTITVYDSNDKIHCRIKLRHHMLETLINTTSKY
ncbi:heme oxygenase 2 isoform b [Pimephales promelas]|nr:heme oxygenase 2 isoform b [Pimephales promelas]